MQLQHVRPESAAPGVRGGPGDAGLLFAGVDWGGSFHQVCVLDVTGKQLLTQRITHDVPGLGLLARRFAELGAPVAVAIERGEGLLVEYLQTLTQVRLYCVSPKISARGPGAVPCRAGEVRRLRRVRAC
jgi:hypothetical protein